MGLGPVGPVWARQWLCVAGRSGAVLLWWFFLFCVLVFGIFLCCWRLMCVFVFLIKLR